MPTLLVTRIYLVHGLVLRDEIRGNRNSQKARVFFARGETEYPAQGGFLDTEFSEESSTSDIRRTVEKLDALDFSDGQEKPIGDLIMEDE